MPTEDFILNFKEGVDSDFAASKSSSSKRALLEIIGRAFFDEKTGVEISGTKLQLESIVNVLRSTKQFHAEINRPDTTVEKIVERLEEKNRCASEFEAIVGMKWPL